MWHVNLGDYVCFRYRDDHADREGYVRRLGDGWFRLVDVDDDDELVYRSFRWEFVRDFRVVPGSGNLSADRLANLYRGDKMNHIPVTLMRARRDAPWVRLHGLTSGSELVSEYRQATASQ